MSWTDDFMSFLKMEDELNLFQAKIGGIKFWERIRFLVYAAIVRQSDAQSGSDSRLRTRFSRLNRLIRSVYRITKNPLLAPKTDILFVCSARRFLHKDGLWWDIYSDPIIGSLGMSSVAVETHFKDRHYSPAKTAGLRYLDFIELIAYLKRKLKLARVEFKEPEAKLLVQIRKEILRRFEVDLNVESLTRRTLEDRMARLPLYVRMLKQIRPRAVVLVQGYIREDIIEACKIQGIPSVELQHGIINPYHISYSFAGESRNKEMFADYILLWGDHWKSNVEFPIQSENIVSVGFPYLDSKKQSLSNVTKKKQIVFISQGVIGEVLSRFAVALNKESEMDHVILYKLHPRECAGWKKKYPDLATSDVEVIDKQEATLHDLFAESRIQVGVCSTALYEGLVFGLQTYVVDAPCVEMMNPLIERGLVRKVSTPGELLSHIKDYDTSEPSDIGHFFRENALENTLSFIRTLCQGTGNPS